MKLFLIQDSDRPAYVMADNYETALASWNTQIAKENGISEDAFDPPDGIQMLADEHELIIFASAHHERIVFNGID